MFINKISDQFSFMSTKKSDHFLVGTIFCLPFPILFTISDFFCMDKKYDDFLYTNRLITTPSAQFCDKFRIVLTPFVTKIVLGIIFVIRLVKSTLLGRCWTITHFFFGWAPFSRLLCTPLTPRVAAREKTSRDHHVTIRNGAKLDAENGRNKRRIKCANPPTRCEYILPSTSQNDH